MTRKSASDPLDIHVDYFNAVIRQGHSCNGTTKKEIKFWEKK